MTTQTSRSFLHSCLKVPIDPCNNCPAPIYNRPKMYLGRLTTTPLDVTRSRKTFEQRNMDITLANSDIRPLAKLYDSIPEYSDINHLPKEEFYSTLDTLRSTCCELRTKSAQACVVEGSSSTSSSIVSAHCLKSSKLSKLTKNRIATVEDSGSKKKGGKSKRYEVCTKSFWRSSAPVVKSHKMEFKTKNRMKGYKAEIDDEIKALQKSLKDFEEELKHRHMSVNSTTSKMSPPPKADLNKTDNVNKNRDKPPVNKSSSSNLRETLSFNNGNIRQSSIRNNASFQKCLKKSFSFNDINSIADYKAGQEERAECKSRSETETLVNRTPLKFSSYFAKKNFPPSKINPPKIVIESPSSETTSAKSSSRSSGKRKKRTKDKRQNEDFKVPFSIFSLGTRAKIEKQAPSPIHPVARPNLAATLRAEVSKRKLKELQNNCTYYDTTPQFDWEVRKTPAWKSLSLNESHKEILSMRLATRKAEQAMQQREYELNMELMRQRVKSAPLLLEGATFWGPHIGKLTHTCQREGASHSCQLNQKKARSKSADSRRRFCSGRDETLSECTSQRSDKLKLLHKIYGDGAKVHTRSASQTPTTKKHQRLTPSSVSMKQPAEERGDSNVLNDSGDELSSLDRAFL
ncbi:uncharacterized protein [Eurosta solidaginis]|uniref:uncharacterized protein isoform X2 n=1 Tax=Eurosta solidaginis TaxID=178769 RepID=UPI0035315F4A